MKKFLGAYFLMVVIALCPEAAHAWPVHGAGVPAIPTLVSGTDFPAGQTPTQASMSTSVPRCGGASDPSWGSGCNTATQRCLQPGGSNPLVVTCQPPQTWTIQSGSASAGTGVINYTSYANIAYPVGEVLILKNTLQTNWSTPILHITSTPTFSGSHVTLNFATQPAAIPVGNSIYVNGITSTDVSGQVKSFGFLAGTPNPNQPVSPAKAWTVTASTTSSVTYDMGSGNQVAGLSVITNHGTSPGTTVAYAGLAITNTTGSGTGRTVNVTCQAGIGLNSLTVATAGTGYAVGDTGTVSAGLCTGNLLTIATPGIQVNGDTSAPYYGTIIAPWVASASACNNSTHACTVSFPVPSAFNCSSSCIDNTAQMVAGQTDDLVMSWHYGEQVPNSLQTGTVMPCVGSKQITPTWFVEMSLNGGAFVKITTPTADPHGAGQSGLSVANTPVYCAQFAASTVPDGLNEVVAIACPEAGNCAILNSQLTADATSGSAVLLSKNHGQQHFTRFGVRASTDPAFPNYNWNDSSNIIGNLGMPITSGSGAGSGAFTLNFTNFAPIPAFDAGTIVGIANTVTTGQSCTVTGGTADGTNLQVNLTGTCNFPTGSSVNISGVSLSAGSGTAAYAWNGNVVPVSVGGTCAAGSCFIKTPSLSTGTWSSGGTVTANWNGTCYVVSSTIGSITCATTDAAATWSSGGTVSAHGNIMCNPGGNGDIPSPYNSFGVPTVAQMDPAHFQLVAFTSTQVSGANNLTNCATTQNTTGCEVTSASGTCGNVATLNETLWLTQFSDGLDKRAPWTPMNERGSLFIYTNAGGAIQKQDAVLDSWGGTATSGCLGTVASAGGTQQSYAGITACSNLTSAEHALAATNLGLSQALSNGVVTIGSTAPTCTLFTRTNNTSGVPFYVGEPVDFAGVDTNSSPQFRMFGLYWIVYAQSNVIALASKPGGTCINDTAAGISYSGASTALLNNDIGFDTLLLQCNASLGCSSYDPITKIGNPETYLQQVGATVTAQNLYAKSSFLTIGPDVATPGKTATAHSVSVNRGTGVQWFSSQASTPSNLDQGGRLRVAVDSTDLTLSLTASVPIGPIPHWATPISGSLGACPVPNGHVCETLNYPAVIDQASRATNGAQFQPPTAAGSPGESIVVIGTKDSSSGTSWDCGTEGTPVVPCKGNLVGGVLVPGIIASTPTSVTFINDAATGSLVYGYTLAVTASGSGGGTGPFTNVALSCVTGGCVGPGGSSGLATLTMSGGHVSTATVTTAGSTYANGDVVGGSAGGNTTFQLTVSTAKITPTNIIMELPAGTYGGPCATVSTGVALNTSGSAFCEASSAVSTGIGTNSYSFPAQMGDASPAIKNANCFQVGTAFTTGPWIQLNSVAQGGTHDILSLTSGVATNGTSLTSIGLDVTNQCDGSGTGPFVFGNTPILLTGMTDIWWDSQTNSSFAYNTSHSAASTFGGVVSGATFYTNVQRVNDEQSFDSATYGWGNLYKYGAAACVSTASVQWDTSCQYIGASVLPVAYGGNANTASNINQGTPWLPIVGSLDASGANITCADPTSGLTVNCVTPLSKALEVATGSLPFSITPSLWVGITICGLSSLPLSGPQVALSTSAVLATYNNNASPYATLGFSPGANPMGSNCSVASQSPSVWLYNVNHIDFAFLQSNALAALPATGHNGDIRAPWSFYNSYMYVNVQCRPCGTMEGVLAQDGGNFDMAYDQLDANLTQLPLGSFYSFFSWGPQQNAASVNNVMLLNSFIGTLAGGASNSPVTTTLYSINNSGGANTAFPLLSAPSNPDPSNTGFWDVTQSIMSPSAGDTSNGVDDNQVAWPAAADGVDGSGNPSVAGHFSSNSLGAVPWFGTLGAASVNRMGSF